MEREIEFFFDCSSPWTYLAFKEIIPLCSRNKCKLVWKPILVGGIFNSINPSVYEARSNPVQAKADYLQKDLKDWSNIRGITINWPNIFPVNSVRAMRGVFYALEGHNKGKGKEAINFSPERYVEKVFKAYWEKGLDISSKNVLSEIAVSLGWNNESFLSFIEIHSTKEKLRFNTEELVRRGGFGSPTIFLDKSNIFFGNDRLKLLEKIIKNQYQSISTTTFPTNFLSDK